MSETSVTHPGPSSNAVLLQIYYTNVIQAGRPSQVEDIAKEGLKILKGITMVVLYDDMGMRPWTTGGWMMI